LSVVQQPFDEGDPSQSHPIRTKSHGSEADPRPVVEEYQSFVRPVRHPVLLPFATKLTGITQAMVDGAPLFPEVFAGLRATLIAYRHPLVFGSWGRFDRIQLADDCTLHGLPNNMPPHLNLKTKFSEVQGLTRKLGMAEALKLCGLKLDGAHHRGIDDARNIARMLPWIVGDKRVGL
jgi:inhibitor of KinA sporulation pathway (predicted exonuclease)